MTMRLPWSAAAVVLGLCLAGAPASARAGDDDPPPLEADLEIHLFDVSALTVGWPDFIGDRGPFPPSPDQVNDEERPSFGGEGEEPNRSLGDVTALMEILKSEDPAAWEGEGVELKCHWPSLLVVRAPKGLCARVAEALSRYQAEVLPVVTVEAVALEGDPSAAGGPQGLAGAIASGALVPIASARVSGHSGERVCALSGGQRAYLQDHDVEVSQESSVSDPIVGVVADGMSLDVRATAAGDHVLLQLRSWLARPAQTKTYKSLQGETIEQPAVDGVTIDETVRVRSGSWSPVQSYGRVVFAVRATVRPFASAPVASEPVPGLRSGPAGDAPPLVTSRIDVHDLGASIGHSRSWPIYLVPSNFTPAEPPGLPQPTPLFPEDGLVGLVKQGVDAPSWEREGARMEVKNHVLVARNGEPQIQAIRRLVEDLRARANRPLRHRLTVVTLPAASWSAFASGGSLDLLEDGGKALLATPGAQVADRLTLRTYPGQRSAVQGGRMLPYLGDYEVEIAQAASIGNPVTQAVLLGSSFDVLSSLTLDGKAVATEVRWDRSRLREMRRVPTKFGDIEAPSIALQRFRGRTVVPLGGTVLLSASLWEGEATLVLLTVSPD